MARPRLSEGLKKERINLTISKETKEMLDAIRQINDTSISEFVEKTIVKEYRKLVKNGKISDNEQIKGQASLNI